MLARYLGPRASSPLLGVSRPESLPRGTGGLAPKLTTDAHKVVPLAYARMGLGHGRGTASDGSRGYRRPIEV